MSCCTLPSVTDGFLETSLDPSAFPLRPMHTGLVRIGRENEGADDAQSYVTCRRDVGSPVGGCDDRRRGQCEPAGRGNKRQCAGQRRFGATGELGRIVWLLRSAVLPSSPV